MNNVQKLILYKKLYKSIQYILLNDWDPIGVKDVEEAQDEYDSYIPQLCKMVIENKPEEDIVDYLVWIERDCMKFTPDINFLKVISKKISSSKKEDL